MGMTMKVNGSMMRTVPHPERIVAQHQELIPDAKLMVWHHALPYPETDQIVLVVVVSCDEVFLPLAASKKRLDLMTITKTNITKMEDFVILCHDIVPSGNQGFVHDVDVRERTPRIRDDLSVIEM